MKIKKVQVNLDLCKPYVSQQRPSFKMNLASASEKLVERQVGTKQLNLIKNGLLTKGNNSQKVLIEEFPDMALLSKIDFNKFNGKSFENTELARGRNINDVITKLVEFAKS